MSTQFYAYNAAQGKALTLYSRTTRGVEWDQIWPDRLHQFVTSGWDTITIVSEHGLPIGTNIIDNPSEEE